MRMVPWPFIWKLAVSTKYCVLYIYQFIIYVCTIITKLYIIRWVVIILITVMQKGPEVATHAQEDITGKKISSFSLRYFFLIKGYCFLNFQRRFSPLLLMPSLKTCRHSGIVIPTSQTWTSFVKTKPSLFTKQCCPFVRQCLRRCWGTTPRRPRTMRLKWMMQTPR